MIERFLPCIGWLRRYDGEAFHGDALASLDPETTARADAGGRPGGSPAAFTR